MILFELNTAIQSITGIFLAPNFTLHCFYDHVYYIYIVWSRHNIVESP